MRIHPFAVVTLLVVTSGCSQRVSSPAVTAGTVQPDLVCAEQLTTRVTLHGTGFTPMSTGTLTTPALVLPAISLERTSDLAGAAATGRVTLPDSPTDPASSLVHWTSGQEMSFDVVPALALQPGVYDVLVTNPDGRSSARFAGGLAAVPRPHLTAADRAALCDAQASQVLVLTGTGFLTVGGAVPTVRIGTFGNADFTSVVATGCTPLAHAFAEGAVSSCTGLIVTIPAGLLAAGDYPLVVTNPPPAGCSSSEVLSLHVEPPPLVTGTVPATLCQGGGTLAVSGSAFLPAATVALVSTTTNPTLNAASNLVNGGGTLITSTFGAGAVLAGRYDVVVDNHDGCTDAAPHQQVSIVTGPVAFFADPEVVFNGVATRVTIYVTTILWPATGSLGVKLVPHGLQAPVTSLVGIQVPGHPNRAQVVVPPGQAPGAYDLFVDDATGCPTVLPNAVTVTASTTVAVRSVTPSFGWTGASTGVTILRDTAAGAPNDHPFVATPRLFLNPVGATASDVAIQVQSVSWLNADTLTAVVPANQPARSYDLIVVNPDGTVGLLPAAFKVQAAPPPVITSATPQSLLANTTNPVVVAGSNFDAAATSVLTCRPAGSNTLTQLPVTLSGRTCTGASCSVTATIAVGAINGATCVLRLTNADGSWFDYSALGVTDIAGNLSTAAPGLNLAKGRRALVAAAGSATSAARFLYAIGGDGGVGSAATPFGDAEVASVDQFGRMGAWAPLPRSSLATPRAFAASATLGRYLYLFGGTDGTRALASGERAMILDPAEVPQLDVGDIVPAATGLDSGYWIYRVTTRFGASDPDNPSGESLPSDERIVKVPTFTGKKIQVQLTWTAPVDALGVPLPNVVGYDVYRTPTVNGTSGAAVLLQPLVAGTTYLDDGSAIPGTQQPLPLGALGRWSPLPPMGVARTGLAGAAGADPTTPGTSHLYALLGAPQATGTVGAPLASYEHLSVTLRANGHQAVGTAWTPGASAAPAARWQLGAWVADHTVAASIPVGTSYLYLGGGLSGGAFVQNVESGRIGAGGDLGPFVAQRPFTNGMAGYAPFTTAGALFTFGGEGAVPSSNMHSALISGAPPALLAGAWTSVGGVGLGAGRYLSGSAAQSAFIFLVGGEAPSGAADATTLTMVW